ncbi:hypothetical protein NC652_033816 [Populus alba x Populus x berolinensis]|nr:hypothetical protein NC652_033816 [Populus alba x Populus x berolinensis]
MIKITGGNRRGALVIDDGLGSLFNLFPHETVLFGDTCTARVTRVKHGRQGIYVASQEGTRRHQERGEKQGKKENVACLCLYETSDQRLFDICQCKISGEVGDATLLVSFRIIHVSLIGAFSGLPISYFRSHPS